MKDLLLALCRTHNALLCFFCLAAGFTMFGPAGIDRWLQTADVVISGPVGIHTPLHQSFNDESGISSPSPPLQQTSKLVANNESGISSPSGFQAQLPKLELATNNEVRSTLVQNHVYQHEMARGNTSCEAFSQDEELLKFGWNFTRYPWRIVKHGARTPRSEVLYGTALAQKTIWEHQHPADCSKAKFLEFDAPASGIGSQLHVLGQALALAMHLGRILILPHGRSHYYDKSFCPDEVGWQCWFQRFTWCKSQGDVKRMGFPPEAPNFNTQSVPQVFHELLSCSPVKKDFWYYWWRAQSVTYMVRFNERTRRAVDLMRKDTLFDCGKPRVEEILEPGTISAHVRHGEKAREANLFSFQEYLQSAKNLAEGNQSIRILRYEPAAESNNNFTYPSNFYAKKSIFVSTGDPQVVVEALKLCEADSSAWRVVYTKVARQNNDPWMRLRSAADARRELLVAMMNLELALEADAWVCSLTSNWCRLIDELRNTIALKASLPYVNLGYGTKWCGAKHPKCYLDW